MNLCIILIFVDYFENDRSECRYHYWPDYYTTNAIESLNSVIRKAINNRRLFPSDRSALKVVYLAIEQAARKWTMPIQDWKRALNRLAIMFEGRLPL